MANELDNKQAAFNAGYAAYCTGEACPYPVNSGMYFDWHAGYDTAEEDSANADGIN